MDNYYSEEGYNEMSGMGAADTTTNTGSSLPSWLQNAISAGTQIAQSAAQVQAAKQIAKTGQVPTAQVNVGVAPDAKKALMIGGGVALGLLALYVVMKK